MTSCLLDTTKEDMQDQSTVERGALTPKYRANLNRGMIQVTRSALKRAVCTLGPVASKAGSASRLTSATAFGVLLTPIRDLGNI